jgi:hypothetical protein
MTRHQMQSLDTTAVRDYENSSETLGRPSIRKGAKLSGKLVERLFAVKDGKQYLTQRGVATATHRAN